MAREDVIDLSLSTDDEQDVSKNSTSIVGDITVHKSISPPPSASASARKLMRTITRSEDDDDYLFIEPLPKRRRLERNSPPLLSHFRNNSLAPSDHETSELSRDSLPSTDSAFNPFRPSWIEESQQAINVETARVLRQATVDQLPASELVIDGLSDNSTKEVPPKRNYSEKTARLLANINRDKKTKTIGSVAGSSTKGRRGSNGNRNDCDEGDSDSSNDDSGEDVSARKRKLSKEEQERRKAERASEQARKKAERETLRETKKTEREAKARQKKLDKETKQKQRETDKVLSQVNKAQWDKDESARQMLVDVPPVAIMMAETGRQQQHKPAAFGEALRAALESVGIASTESHTSPLAGVIRWRRKVESAFNEELEVWQLLPIHDQKVLDEKVIMPVISGERFATMCMRSKRSRVSDNSDAGIDHQANTLRTHVAMLKLVYPVHRIVYLIEGLDIYLKKAKNSRNRSYQASIRRQDVFSATAAATVEGTVESVVGSSRRNSENPSARIAATSDLGDVDEEAIEDSLLDLQLDHGCAVYQTTTAPESIEFIVNFTKQLSTVPYKLQRENAHGSASFCMDVGQIAKGRDCHDTFVKMLQQVIRVTAPVANGVAADYPGVSSLVEGFKGKGPLALQDVLKYSPAHQNALPPDARVGKALSQRLYKVFMALDPTLLDV